MGYVFIPEALGVAAVLDLWKFDDVLSKKGVGEVVGFIHLVGYDSWVDSESGEVYFRIEKAEVVFSHLRHV